MSDPNESFNLDEIVDEATGQSQDGDESTEQFPIRSDSDNSAQELADTICAAFFSYELSLVQSSSFHSLNNHNSYKRDVLSKIDGYLCRVQAATLPNFDKVQWQIEAVDDEVLTGCVSAVAIEIVTYLKGQLAEHFAKFTILSAEQFYSDLKVLIGLLEQFSVVKNGEAEIEKPDLSSAKELLVARQEFRTLEVTAFSVNGQMDKLQKALMPDPVSSEGYSCKVRTSPRDLSVDHDVGDDGEEKKSPLSELLFTTSDKIALDLLRLKFSVMKKGLSLDDFSFKRTTEEDKDAGKTDYSAGLVSGRFIGNGVKDEVKFNLLKEIDGLLALLSKCNSQGKMDGVEFSGKFALTRAIIHKYYGLNRTPKEQGDFEKKLLKQTHDGVKITVDHNLSKMYLSLNQSNVSVNLSGRGKGKNIEWSSDSEKNAVWNFIKWKAKVLGAPITRAQTISYALVKKYCDVSLNGESATISYLNECQRNEQLALDLKASGRLWCEPETSKNVGMFSARKKGKNVIDVPANSEAQDKTLDAIRKDISEKMQKSSKESHYKDILRAFVNAVQKFELAYRRFTGNLLSNISCDDDKKVECTTYDNLKCVKQKDGSFKI